VTTAASKPHSAPEVAQKELQKEQENKWLRAYRQMVRIRLFEEQVNELYTRALMPGLAHLYSGEEAVAVGICEALNLDDYITSTHRGHGHCLAKGASPDRMFAELLGKEAGYCRGKGGSMHIADPATGNLIPGDVQSQTRRVLDNIASAAKKRPLVIQSMFMRINGDPPPASEILAFCDRLNEIVACGGAIKLVQVYTVARLPAESFVSALTDAEVDQLVATVRERTGLAAEPFYGGDKEGSKVQGPKSKVEDNGAAGSS